MNNITNILKPKSTEDIRKDLSKISKRKLNQYLMIESMNGNLNMIKILLDIGADINAKDHINWTPLFWATCYGNEEVVKYLLEHGAKLIKTKGNITALDYARRSKQPKTIITLLEQHKINNENILLKFIKKFKNVFLF